MYECLWFFEWMGFYLQVKASHTKQMDSQTTMHWTMTKTLMFSGVKSLNAYCLGLFAMSPMYTKLQFILFESHTTRSFIVWIAFYAYVE